MNKFSPKQKALLLIFIPTMLALGMIVSFILWGTEAKYTIWKVAITWGIIVIAIDVVMFINTKIVARPKKFKPNKKKGKKEVTTETEEVIGDNPSDVKINWDQPESPKIERMGDTEKQEGEKKDPLADLAGVSGIVDTEPLRYEDSDVLPANSESEKPIKRLKKPAVAKPTPEPKAAKKKKADSEHNQINENAKESEIEVVMPEQFDEAAKK